MIEGGGGRPRVNLIFPGPNFPMSRWSIFGATVCLGVVKFVADVRKMANPHAYTILQTGEKKKETKRGENNRPCSKGIYLSVYTLMNIHLAIIVSVCKNSYLVV